MTRDKVLPRVSVTTNGHCLDFNLMPKYVYLFQFSPHICQFFFQFSPHVTPHLNNNFNLNEMPNK